MPAFQFVAELVTRHKFKNLEQDQNEALIDVLTAAKAIDGQLKAAERAELEEIVEKLDWKGSGSKDAYIDRSIDRAVDIEPEPGPLRSHFDDIGDRLGEDWLRQEGYYLAARIVLADDQIVDNERVLLQNLVEGFDIGADTQETIITKIRKEIEF